MPRLVNIFNRRFSCGNDRFDVMNDFQLGQMYNQLEIRANSTSSTERKRRSSGRKERGEIGFDLRRNKPLGSMLDIGFGTSTSAVESTIE